MAMQMSISVSEEMYKYIKENSLSPSKVFQNAVINTHQHGSYTQKIQALSTALQDANDFINERGLATDYIKYIGDKKIERARVILNNQGGIDTDIPKDNEAV